MDHPEDFLLKGKALMTLMTDSEMILHNLGTQTFAGFHHKMEINLDLIMKIRTCVSQEIIEVHHGEVLLNKEVQGVLWMWI